MLVFVVLLLVPMLIQHLGTEKDYINYDKKNKIAFLFFFAMLTLLVMFRHESVGTDTNNYISIFNGLVEKGWGEIQNSSVEIGFSYFNKIISIFTKSSQIFLAVVALITSILIYPTYKRLCIDPSLTIAIFCIMSTFVMMFSGIRQMVAVGIGFIAYEFVRNKKLIPFIIAVLIAITFHTSAFMLAFMYPIYHAKITKKWLFAITPAIVGVFVFNKQIFSVLSWLIERYTTYEGGLMQTGAYTMLVLFAFFVVFAFLIPDESRIDKETIGLRNFLLLALVLQMFAPLHTIAMRMNYYYIIFIPLLLPKIIDCRSERWSQVAVAARHIMVVFFSTYFFISASTAGGLHVFPYHFFWENIG